jgi:hypothetical protein
VSLTKREREVLHWIVNGSSNGQIAAILGISSNTVGNHRANLHNSEYKAKVVFSASGRRPQTRSPYRGQHSRSQKACSIPQRGASSGHNERHRGRNSMGRADRE